MNAINRIHITYPARNTTACGKTITGDMRTTGIRGRVLDDWVCLACDHALTLRRQQHERPAQRQCEPMQVAAE